MSKLLVFTEPSIECELLEGSTSIGRSPTSDITINDKSVSKRHALITLQSMKNGDVKIQIADLHSTNGTFVNGDRIKYHTLSDTDQISIGTVQCSYIANN